MITRLCYKREVEALLFLVSAMRTAILSGLLSFSALLTISPIAVYAQNTTGAANSQSQPQVTKSPEGKKEEAERAAARAPARHFDRILIIVLENVDYERAIQDPNL